MIFREDDMCPLIILEEVSSEMCNVNQLSELPPIPILAKREYTMVNIINSRARVFSYVLLRLIQICDFNLVIYISVDKYGT